MAALIVAHGSQERVGRALGYSGSAIGKAARDGAVGYGVRDALLKHLGITVEELVRRYAPQAAIPFVGNARAPGFEGRASAVDLARKRGVSDDALRLIVTDPAFNRDEFKGQPIAFWSKKIDELHAALTATPAPRREERNVALDWDPAAQKNRIGPSRHPRPPSPKSKDKRA